MISFSKATVARAFLALSVAGVVSVAPHQVQASACDASTAIRISSASQPTALTITGTDVQRTSMDTLWDLVSGTDDTKFRVLGTAIGAANNWMGNCSYPGIGLGVGSGFDYSTRNVTIWLWQDGVNLDLAREAVYALIGEGVGSPGISAPLSDEPGVSILNGSPRTNSLHVTVNMVWPAFATAARISNDGAFSTARTTTVPLAESFSWTLEDAGEGIYSTSIFVRFVGPGIDTTRTYVDSIVLDRSPVTTTTIPSPSTQSVEVTAIAASAPTAIVAKASASATSIHTLSLSALRSGKNPSGRVLNAKAKVCRMVNNQVVVLKSGICRLNVTVRTPKGRKTSSVVTISCTDGLCRHQQ